MSDAVRRQLAALLARCDAMTLGMDGLPPIPSLPFACDAALALYFLLEPTSPVAARLAQDSRCAAVAQAAAGRQIEIEGWAVVVATPEDWDVAHEVWRARFPDAGDAPARGRFYRLMPRTVRLADTRVAAETVLEWRADGR